PERADVDADEPPRLELLGEEAEQVAPRAADVEDRLAVYDRLVARVEARPEAARLLLAPPEPRLLGLERLAAAAGALRRCRLRRRRRLRRLRAAQQRRQHGFAQLPPIVDVQLGGEPRVDRVVELVV